MALGPEPLHVHDDLGLISSSAHGDRDKPVFRKRRNPGYGENAVFCAQLADPFEIDIGQDVNDLYRADELVQAIDGGAADRHAHFAESLDHLLTERCTASVSERAGGCD